MKYDVLVIGGGATGSFTALDLALRGLRVALIERNGFASGTSGRYHGMLHSGARYAVNDPVSAKECISENAILSRIAPHAIVDTGGVFVALNEDEVSYQERLEGGLRSAGIPFEELRVEDLLKEEKHLSRSVRSALWVPDKVMHAYDLIISVLLTAHANGAHVMPYREVTSLIKSSSGVVGAKVFNRIRDRTEEIYADVIVNAAGPWAGRIAQMAGADVEIMPTAGVMGVTQFQLVNHILNRMRPPSDGDIIIPYSQNVSITGTTVSIVEDPDSFVASEDDLQLLLDEGSAMVPKLRELGFSRYYASIRPLLRLRGEGERAGREATRTFEVFDHEKEGIHGIITVSGGKFTTARLMAERVSDMVAEKLGSRGRSRTAETILLGARVQEDAERISRASGLDYWFVRRLLETIGSVDEERFRPALQMLILYALAEVR
ncbi:MAG: FAD-dependent oxidoreductase [Nitrososphaeria archaeon]